MKNSHQNSKSCMASRLNAGDKMLVKSNCPAELTEKVKEALLKEIEAFDKPSAQHEADVSATGGPTNDAYHDWLEQNEGHEPPEANPDIIAEGEGLNYITSNKDDSVVSLLKEFRQTLTARELQVWNLVMAHQLSHRQVERLLKVQRRSVSVYLKRAKVKFIKFMEEKRDERKG